MDDRERARLTRLKPRQARSNRIPAILEAWRNLGGAVTALSHERSEHLVEWLRANWRQPDRPVGRLDMHMDLMARGHDAVLVADFWQWDEAVTVLVPTRTLIDLKRRLREIYPDGFLIADQLITNALLVDFDDHAEGTKIAQIGSDL